MRCVVTGGCGFIGSNLVDRAVGMGWDVTIVDDLSTGSINNLNPKAKFHEGSILDEGLMKRACEGVDVIFHQAAWARVPRSVEDPVGTNRVNVEGTLQVFQTARSLNIPRVVYASSSSIYGDQDTHLMQEDLRPNPVSPYALQKLIGEQYASMFCRLFNTSIVSLRYFNVYGPRQVTEGAYTLVIGRFLKLKTSGQAMTIFGDGEQTRAYTHVSDVVEANIRAAQVQLKPGQHVPINVGTTNETSVNEIAKRIGGKTEHIQPNPRGDFEERRKAADWSRAKEVLGWSPKVDLETGLKALL